VKIASAFNQAIAKGDGTIVRRPSMTMFPEQTLLTGKHQTSTTDRVYSRYGYSKRDWRQFPWCYLGIHSQWRRSRMRVINGGFGMVLDGSKEALRLQSMLLGCQ
jgi:hypothetical protein